MAPLARFNARLVEFEGTGVRETFEDFPHPWIVTLLHSKGNASRFGKRQFDVSRQQLHNGSVLVIRSAYQLTGQNNAVHKDKPVTERG